MTPPGISRQPYIPKGNLVRNQFGCRLVVELLYPSWRMRFSSFYFVCLSVCVSFRRYTINTNGSYLCMCVYSSLSIHGFTAFSLLRVHPLLAKNAVCSITIPSVIHSHATERNSDADIDKPSSTVEQTRLCLGRPRALGGTGRAVWCVANPTNQIKTHHPLPPSMYIRAVRRSPSLQVARVGCRLP